MLRNTQPAEREITFDQRTREAIQRKEADVLIGNKTLSSDEVKRPIELAAGSNEVKIRVGDQITTLPQVVSDKNNPTFIELTPDGKVRLSLLHHLLARSVILSGGTVRQAGSDKRMTVVEDIPANPIEIEEIDLSGVKKVPVEEIELIKKLGPSLKLLVLPRTAVSHHQIEELEKELGADHVKAASQEKP